MEWNTIYIRFELFLLFWALTPVSWDVTPCNLVDRYQHFGGNCHLQPQEEAGSWHLHTILHGITSMKNTILVQIVSVKLLTMYETSQMAIQTKEAGSDWTQHWDKTLCVTSRTIQDWLEWKATLTILWKKWQRSGYIRTLLTLIWDSHKLI